MGVVDEQTGKAYVRDPKTGRVIELGSFRYWEIWAERFNGLGDLVKNNIRSCSVASIRDCAAAKGLTEQAEQLKNIVDSIAERPSAKEEFGNLVAGIIDNLENDSGDTETRIVCSTALIAFIYEYEMGNLAIEPIAFMFKVAHKNIFSDIASKEQFTACVINGLEKVRDGGLSIVDQETQDKLKRFLLCLEKWNMTWNHGEDW